jgi:hypothetical protein
VVHGAQLQEMLGLWKSSLLDVIELFDWAGANRIRANGYTQANLAHVKISAKEVMIAGVMLSRRIATKHKLRFVLGLVDSGDTGSLTESQFAAFITALSRGLSAVFCVSHEHIPTKAEIEAIAQRLYARIGAVAGRRLQELYVNGTAAVKASVVDAIRDLQLTLSPGSGKNQQSPIATAIAKPQVAKAAGLFARHTKPGLKVQQQVLKYCTIQDWCCGSLSDADPMALPYRLAIARFCPDRDGDVADEFDESLSSFQLLHSERVPVPEEDLATHSKDMLTRAEVVLARDVFRHCVAYRRLRLAKQELLELGPHVPKTKLIWSRLSKALDALSDESFTRGGGIDQVTFSDLLLKVCSKAKAKHLRMFEAWCSEFDALKDLRTACSELEQAADVFAKDNSKRVMPSEELEALDREFDRLDISRKGYILPSDIMSVWGWTYEAAHETVTTYDADGRGRIRKPAFIKMMCPGDFRLPEMSGVGRELFGKLIASQAAEKRSELNVRESQFSATDTDQSLQSLVGSLFVPPTTSLPEVREDAWVEWNAAFDKLDKNGDDEVMLNDMLESGLLAEHMCRLVVRLIDPEIKDGFSRGSFLTALLRAHQVRKSADLTQCQDMSK